MTGLLYPDVFASSMNRINKLAGLVKLHEELFTTPPFVNTVVDFTQNAYSAIFLESACKLVNGLF
jgi:hypothetical protein